MIDLVAAQAVILELEPVASTQIVAGEPSTGSLALGTLGGTELGGTEYGVWEMTPGAMSDVEEDELFVVLFGAATVAFDTGIVWQLGPGSTGRLDAGTRTVWTVTETLRKVYVTG